MNATIATSPASVPQSAVLEKFIYVFVHTVLRTGCYPLKILEYPMARPWGFRLIRALSVLAVILLLLPPLVVRAQEESAPPELEFWGLEDFNILSLALTPDGDVVAGTLKGIWRANHETPGVESFPVVGLPEQCQNPVNHFDCIVSSIGVTSRGDVFIVVGSGRSNVGSLGVFRSAASSGTWDQVAAPKDMPVSEDGSGTAWHMGDLSIGPDDTVYVVAAGERDSIYRSQDNGTTWQQVYRGSGNIYQIDRIAVGPDGQVWFNGGFFNYFPARYTMTSSDGGFTWEPRPIDPNDPDGDPNHNIADFAFDTENRVYVTTIRGGLHGTPDFPLGVYRTADSGVSWEQLTPDDIALALNAIVVAPNGDILYGNGGGVWRSGDDGATWSLINQPIETIKALQIDRDGHLWVGTERSLYRTADVTTEGLPPSEPVDTAATTPVPPAAITPVPTSAPLPPTASPEPTATSVPPTSTAMPSSTQVPPAATLMPTVTPVPPDAIPSPTSTQVLPTATPVPPAGGEPAIAIQQRALRADCLANGGEFYEKASGEYGCRYPGGVVISCSPDGACSQQPVAPPPAVSSPAPSVPCAPCPVAAADGPVIFTTGSFGSRFNGPTQPTQFTLETASVITRIRTYHLGGSTGAAQGSIALRGDEGTLYGPWPATPVPIGESGPGQIWEVAPGITLSAGVYTVIDSDPDTWSQNADTGSRGMTVVYGSVVEAE